MSKIKLNKVKVSKVVIDKEDGIHREHKRKHHPGRPINKKSARYIRLQQQEWYETINAKFVNGNTFKLKENQSAEYHYTRNADRDGGALFNGIGHYVCNIDYIGRTKVTGFTYVLDKKVNVELNLKTLKFVS